MCHLFSNLLLTPTCDVIAPMPVKKLLRNSKIREMVSFYYLGKRQGVMQSINFPQDSSDYPVLILGTAMLTTRIAVLTVYFNLQ